MPEKDHQPLLLRLTVGIIVAVLYASSALLFEEITLSKPPENVGTKFS